MRFASFLAALLLAAGTATGAFAQQSPAVQPANPTLSVKEINDRVEGQGYRNITQVEREGDRYEVKATTAEGGRVELYLDAHTGEVVKTKRK